MFNTEVEIPENEMLFWKWTLFLLSCPSVRANISIKTKRNLLNLFYFSFQAWFTSGRYMFWRISKVSGNWLHQTFETRISPYTSSTPGPELPFSQPWLGGELIAHPSNPLSWRDKLLFMGKTQLLHLFAFLYKHCGLADRVPFLKFFPILGVEAGTDGLTRVHGADGRIWAWREALPTGVR